MSQVMCRQYIEKLSLATKKKVQCSAMLLQVSVESVATNKSPRSATV